MTFFESIVELWWIALSVIALINVYLWYQSGRQLRSKNAVWVWRLSGGYVFGCAFRSFFPRVDVQRICLFDGWISNVFIGRSVATIAEMCFIAVCAFVMRDLALRLNAPRLARVSLLLIPFVFIAELFSWWSVISRSFIGHIFEESIWLMSGVTIAVVLTILRHRVQFKYKRLIDVFLLSAICYVIFMGTVDVPMYVGHWRQDLAAGYHGLSFSEGWPSLFNYRVTFSVEEWLWEMPWQTLYFSFAVWISIGLVYVSSFLSEKHEDLQLASCS